jgi:hypothetical protein
MKITSSRAVFAAALTAAVTTTLAAVPAEAIDWHRAVERHYEAAETATFEPRTENPQWDFDLETVINDMEWRQRTAKMLRGLPKPSTERPESSGEQLADRPEQPPLRFAF